MATANRQIQPEPRPLRKALPRKALPRQPHPGWLGGPAANDDRRPISASEFWERLDP